MIRVLFFASIRERLDCAQMLAEHVESVEHLIEYLIEANGALWAEVLRAPNIIVAVNQEVAERSTALHDGDEVAFFPPVTGG